jgi:hypothetical protein
MRRLLTVLAFTSLVACDTFDPLRDNTVTGTWRGSASGQNFVLNLQQAGSTVAGTGTLSGTPTRTLAISGNYQQPNFSATLTPDQGTPITMQGTVEGGSFVGTLNGGGFSGTGLALLRD